MRAHRVLHGLRVVPLLERQLEVEAVLHGPAGRRRDRRPVIVVLHPAGCRRLFDRRHLVETRAGLGSPCRLYQHLRTARRQVQACPDHDWCACLAFMHARRRMVPRRQRVLPKAVQRQGTIARPSQPQQARRLMQGCIHADSSRGAVARTPAAVDPLSSDADACDLLGSWRLAAGTSAEPPLRRLFPFPSVFSCGHHRGLVTCSCCAGWDADGVSQHARGCRRLEVRDLAGDCRERRQTDRILERLLSSELGYPRAHAVPVLSLHALHRSGRCPQTSRRGD